MTVYSTLKNAPGKLIGYVKWNTLFLKDRTARRNKSLQVDWGMKYNGIWLFDKQITHEHLFSLKMIYHDGNLDFRTLNAKIKHLI